MKNITNEDLLLAIQGKCPFCKQVVKDWKAPSGIFAPEMWATLSEEGIDPGTGHLQSCKRIIIEEK